MVAVGQNQPVMNVHYWVSGAPSDFSACVGRQSAEHIFLLYWVGVHF